MGRKIYGGRSAARQQTLKIPDKPSVSAKTGYGGGSGAGVPPWSLRFRLHQGRRPSPVGRRRTGINPFRPFRYVPPGCPKGAGVPLLLGLCAPRKRKAAGEFRRKTRTPFQTAASGCVPGMPKTGGLPGRQRFCRKCGRGEKHGSSAPLSGDVRRRWQPKPEDGPEI